MQVFNNRTRTGLHILLLSAPYEQAGLNLLSWIPWKRCLVFTWWHVSRRENTFTKLSSQGCNVWDHFYLLGERVPENQSLGHCLKADVPDSGCGMVETRQLIPSALFSGIISSLLHPILALASCSSSRCWSQGGTEKAGKWCWLKERGYTMGCLLTLQSIFLIGSPNGFI